LSKREKVVSHIVDDCASCPEFLKNKDLRLILFGGKGGVGKTTMAAAAAVQLAQLYLNEKKVLVISTDPAHSLGDSFGIQIGDKVTPIQWSVVSGQWSVVSGQWSVTNDQCPMTNLYARELDAARLLDKFKQKNDAVIKKLANRGTYFDQQDIAEFFDLSLPGMDEVMAVIEIANLLKEGTYGVLILDTAPTGHTVRMLNLPEQMRKWIEVMDLMQHKHRYMFTHFTGKKYVKDECDIFLEDLSSDIDRVKKLLSSRETTRFVPVTIPEPMSIYETKRLIGSLEKIHVPVKEIIVNRVAESEGCLFCRARKEDQKKPLIEIEEAFSRYDLIKVPLFPNEIRGIGGLTRIADYLRSITGPSVPLKTSRAIKEQANPCLTLKPDLEFVLLGGKGGVGKTSLASATALYLARSNQIKKVLVFSTDPAHSLSDSFDRPIGDRITPVQCSVFSVQWSVSNDQQRATSNLFALEIDANRLWDNFKGNFKEDMEKVFNKFLGSGTDIKFDREVMTEMLELAPPGLDEIMALDKIIDLRSEGAFDIFVLDTSPTGHLLRFLELPDMVREWLKTFFKLLLKYRGIVNLARAAEKALILSKSVRRIQEILTDPEKTAFIAVTIPEAMGLLELERLLNALDATGIPCDHIAVNKVVPLVDCGFCSIKRAEQQGYISEIRSKFPSHTITQVPLFPKQVRGIPDLDEISRIIFQDNDRSDHPRMLRNM
jgi:arsenite-transporting ATPase